MTKKTNPSSLLTKINIQLLYNCIKRDFISGQTCKQATFKLNAVFLYLRNILNITAVNKGKIAFCIAFLFFGPPAKLRACLGEKAIFFLMKTYSYSDQFLLAVKFICQCGVIEGDW